MDDLQRTERSDRSTTAAAPPTTDPATGLPTTRRRYLAGTVALGVLGGVGLLASPAAATETFADVLASYSDRFGTIIDVTEAGADNTGNQPITGVLRTLVDDDTLLVFPPGTYAMDEQLRFTGFTNFGLLGNDATIVPANVYDYAGPQYRLFRLGVQYRPGRDLLFRGFTIDQSAPDTGVRVIESFVEDGLEVRDILIQGQHDSGAFGPALTAVMDPAGSGHIQNFSAADGGAWVSDTPDPLGLWRGPTGMLLSKYHAGTLEIRDCTLGGFPDNGLYGHTTGTVNVVGGLFKNSNAASIRLAGTNCTVDGTTVTVDENPAHFRNQRGIRLDEGTGFRISNVTVNLPAPNGDAISVLSGVASARIEGTTVSIGDRVNHGIVISPGAGPADIVDTDVVIDGGGNAIQINGTDEGPVVVEGVSIRGTASGAKFRHAIRCERNGCEFRGVTVRQSGPDKRRAIVFNGDDCLLYKGDFKTTHHPVIDNSAGTWMETNTLESYGGYAAIRLNNSSSDATIKDNTLYYGVLDLGCDGLRMYGNDVVE